MKKNPPPVHCNLCGNTRYYLVHEEKKKSSQPVLVEQKTALTYTISEGALEKPEKIVRCMTCDLVYAIPKESHEEITQSYVDMEDPEYVAEEAGRRRQAKQILKLLHSHQSGGKILDVGCGPGFFLAEAKSAGWQTQGVDLSGWAKQYADEKFGIPIFQGSLHEAAFPDKSFDAVVMNDVIEHLNDPKSSLSEIRRILKNDGILYLSTPDINSFWSRLLKAKWWGINKHHLFYFSKKTLEQLFYESGFKGIHYSPYPRIFSWNYWIKRLRHYPSLVHFIPEVICRFFGLSQKTLSITLHDQLGVVAKKIHKLENIAFDESDERSAYNPHPLKRLKIAVVLPAYNAAKTLERTVADIPQHIVDEIILVDDKSSDDTVAIAKKLGLIVFEHAENKGYGANQKTCYQKALERGADIAVMCHPDYQYDPKIIPQLVEPILKGQADAVFGSRMIKGGALEGGMPLWKHNANILLTAFENVVLGTYLTEYHSGFRAYSSKVLRSIRFEENSDGFIFDTEIIVQTLLHRFKIDEVPIRTRYFEEASSIRLWPSILYGLGIIRVMAEYVLHKHGWLKLKRFEPKPIPENLTTPS